MPFFMEHAISFSSESGAEFVFNDPLQAPDGIDMAYIDVAEGWADTAPLRVSTTPKVVGSGANTYAKYTNARTITFEGMIACNSELETDEAWSLLVESIPQDEVITVTHDGPIPRFVQGVMTTKIDQTQMMPLGFRFSFEITCDDPLKYDAENVLTGTSGISGVSTGGMTFPLVFPLVFNSSSEGSGNSVILTNLGNAASPPIIQIVGPLESGWRLELIETGESIAFDIDIPAGITLEIDHKLQTAELDGSPIAGLVVGDWWSLRKHGVNTIKLFGSYNADAHFTVTARSAWR